MALANFDVIEMVNLTSPLPTDSYEQLCKSVLDLGHGRDDYDEDDQPLPSLEKVLRDIEEAQDDLQLFRSEPCNRRRTG